MIAGAEHLGSEHLGDRQVVIEVDPEFDNRERTDQPSDHVFFLGGDYPAGDYDRWQK